MSHIQFCPVCDINGKSCGSQDSLVYYHMCVHCGSVWLSDRSKYDDKKQRVYEDYIKKQDKRIGNLGAVSAFEARRMDNYKKLAERFFYLLYFIADNGGKRIADEFRFIEIGFDLPSVFTYFHDYGFDVTALDLKILKQFTEYLEPLLKTGRLHLQESDFETWKTDKTFDVLWMTHVLEHFEDTLAALKKIRTLLKETGVAFISSPDAEVIKELGPTGLIGHMHPEQHLFMYTIETFSQLCKEAGLKVIFSERYGDPIPGQFEFTTKMEWRAILVPQERSIF